jgi:hypothetical protein
VEGGVHGSGSPYDWQNRDCHQKDAVIGNASGIACRMDGSGEE